MDKLTSLALLILLVQTTFAVDTILITRLNSHEFKKTANFITSKLSNTYNVKESVISKSTTQLKYNSSLKMITPKLHITLGDKSFSLLKNYKDKLNSNTPSISLMGLDFHKKLAKGASKKFNLAAISYETPAFSIIRNFQKITKTRFKEVHVLYRPSKDQQKVLKQKRFLKRIGINLVLHDVENNSKDVNLIHQNLNLSLEKLNSYNKRPIVWVPLDSVLINNQTFNSIWLPISRQNKVTFISGIKKLASVKLSFCVFAMSPEVKELSSQVEEMVDSIINQDIKASEIGIEEILTSNSFLNLKKAKDLNVKINKESLLKVSILK